MEAPLASLFPLSENIIRTCDLVNTHRTIKGSIKIFGTLSVGLALFAVSSCGVLHEQILSYKIERQYDSELKELVRGHEAFQRREFKKALEIFDTLRHQAKNNEIVRKATFALACTHFVLAENPEEFKAAMALWEAWKQILPTSIADEDPRMLDQLLQKLSYVEAETKTGGASNSSKTAEYQHELRTNEKEIRSLKQKLEDREKEIIVLKEQNMLLKGKEAELEKLRNQINALEVIEHKIQRKKKEMTSP